MSIRVASFWDEPYKEKEVCDDYLSEENSKGKSKIQQPKPKAHRKTSFANSYDASPKVPGHKREKIGKIYRR